MALARLFRAPPQQQQPARQSDLQQQQAGTSDFQPQPPHAGDRRRLRQVGEGSLQAGDGVQQRPQSGGPH